MRSIVRGTVRPTVVDLFAGAGLFSHAFKREGFEVVHAIEQDRYAAATYAANLGAHVVLGDVTRHEPRGRCDVLIAGPPCQGFSTLGKRDRRDPRNRLSLQVVRWAEILKPRVIVIENVAAFLESRVWKLLARRLERLGYDVTAEVCDAVDFGVPQHRVRSATFASRVGPIKLPRTARKHVTVAEAWADLPTCPTGRGLDVYLPPTPLSLARMRVIPPGGNKRDVMQWAPHLVPPSWLARTRNEMTDVFGRIVWDKPSNTIRTEFVNPSKGRYIHPDQHRGISLREAARLQSIPDGYTFAGRFAYVIARQIGNGVPPRLGRAIARQVLNYL